MQPPDTEPITTPSPRRASIAPAHSFYPWLETDNASAPPAAGKSMHVNIGELKIGSRCDQLQALLGSCVGIGFIWRKRGRCGLAHCLLPESPTPLADLSARYVSHAVPSLLRLIGATEADYADIEVIVAGGSTMLDACSARLQIGQQNIDAAQKYLRQAGLNVQYCRVSGKTGRKLSIDCATFTYQVSDIQKTARDVQHAYA